MDEPGVGRDNRNQPVFINDDVSNLRLNFAERGRIIFAGTTTRRVITGLLLVPIGLAIILAIATQSQIKCPHSSCVYGDEVAHTGISNNENCASNWCACPVTVGSGSSATTYYTCEKGDDPWAPVEVSLALIGILGLFGMFFLALCSGVCCPCALRGVPVPDDSSPSLGCVC